MNDRSHLASALALTDASLSSHTQNVSEEHFAFVVGQLGETVQRSGSRLHHDSWGADGGCGWHGAIENPASLISAALADALGKPFPPPS